jgi:hypothetical protein
VNPFESFLGKITSLLQISLGEKEALLHAIKNISKIELDEKELEIKNGVAVILASPSVKNEIYMRRSAILKELETIQNGKTKVRDIR